MFNKNAIDFLEKTDFLSRFLDFVERYENFRNLNSNSTAYNWAKDRNYEYIMHYLKSSPIEESVPFTLAEFASMSETEMAFWHDYCIELKYLFDEKKALYETIHQYYEV